jgi:hypothetical protein
MNHQVKPLRAGGRAAGLLLALLLSPLAYGEAQNIASPIMSETRAWLSVRQKASHSYLEVVGPPPLRFLEGDAAPAMDVPVLPPSAPPSFPGLGKGVGQSSILDVVLGPGWRPPAASAARPEGNAHPLAQPAPAAQIASPPILPDEGRPRLHPEDFLPFFQFPGAAGQGAADSSAPVPPAPGRLPPSTASYQQE